MNVIEDFSVKQKLEKKKIYQYVYSLTNCIHNRKYYSTAQRMSFIYVCVQQL